MVREMQGGPDEAVLRRRERAETTSRSSRYRRRPAQMALLATTSPADPPLGNSGRRAAETGRRRSWLRLDDDGHAPRSGGCVDATGVWRALIRSMIARHPICRED